MTLEEAKVELEKFVKLKTTMRPAFVQPLLDSVEQKHGHWEYRFIEDEDPSFRRRWYCSCCGHWNTYGRPRYCMYCGAKMEEAETDEID